MRLVSPSSPLSCVPLRIVDADGSRGAYLGGRPPARVSPASATPPMRYFATVPIASDPDLFVSISTADLEALMPLRGRVNEPIGVDLVVHSFAPRETSPSPFDSQLSAHSLKLLPPSNDRVADEEGETVRSGHK